MPSSPCLHGGKINGRNGPRSSSMMIASRHHGKPRPPSPMTREEEKRRTQDDKWKSGSSEKLLRERGVSSRGQPFDDASHDLLLSKHSISSRLSKSTRAPSLDYIRMKNPAAPSEPSVSKKKTKEKPVDKVRG